MSTHTPAQAAPFLPPLRSRGGTPPVSPVPPVLSSAPSAPDGPSPPEAHAVGLSKSGKQRVTVSTPADAATASDSRSSPGSANHTFDKSGSQVRSARRLPPTATATGSNGGPRYATISAAAVAAAAAATAPVLPTSSQRRCGGAAAAPTTARPMPPVAPIGAIPPNNTQQQQQRASRGTLTTMSLASSSCVALAEPPAALRPREMWAAVTLATVSPAEAPAVTPVPAWAESAGAERESGRRTLALARALFQRVVRTNPRNTFAFQQQQQHNDKRSSGSGDGSPVDQLTMLATRVAVSALLLQETVLSLPRHQAVLEPYVRALIRAVYVPDGIDAVTAALGGDLVHRSVLDGLRASAAAAGSSSSSSAASHANLGSSSGGVEGRRNDNANASSSGSSASAISGIGRDGLLVITSHAGNNHSSSSSSLSLVPSSTGATITLEDARRDSAYGDDYLLALLTSGGAAGSGGVGAAQLTRLLGPFARKPFLVALLELAPVVAAMGHAVRSRQLHVRRLPRIFDMTHVSWTRTLLRAALRAWRRLCNVRRVQEHRHRARWARRWALERVRVGIRSWRGLAAYSVQAAEADSAAKAAVTERRNIIARFTIDVDNLLKTSRAMNLSLMCAAQDRAVMERETAALEAQYREMLHRTREADRVGSLLMDALLLPLTERAGESLAAITSNALALGPPRPQQQQQSRLRQQLSTSTSGGTGGGWGERPATLTASPHQQHYIGALALLVKWANTRVTEDGRETEELLAMSPVTAERHLTKKVKAVGSGSGTGDDTTATPAPATVTAAAAAPDAEPDTNSSGAIGVFLEPIFNSLLPYGGDDDDNPSSGSGTSGDKDTSPSVFVPIPLYKYLVLMRCFKQAAAVDAVDAIDGWQPGGGSSSPSADSGGGGGSGGTTCLPGAPTLETIRMVKTADFAVLTNLCALHTRAWRRAAGDDKDDETDGARGGAEDLEGASLVAQLPPDMLAAAEDVAKILVDCYERLTGTACVVSARQLLHRGRGPQLVLLAALLRHYASWMIRRAQADEPGAAADAAEAVSLSPLAQLSHLMAMRPSTSAAAAAAAASTKVLVERHHGRRHPRFADWYHPPASHLQWPERVANQRGWVAVSFSAMHRAVYESAQQRPVLSVEEQELAMGFVRLLTLSRIADLLPTAADQSPVVYVGLLAAVERCFSRLRHVFHLYAIPLREIRRARRVKERAAQAAAAAARRRHGGGRPPPSPGRTVQPKKAKAKTERTEAGDGDDDGGVGIGGSGPRREQPHITANGFWHLLCDAGVAAGPGTAHTSVTLHRAAVFSIVEHVVFRALDPAASTNMYPTINDDSSSGDDDSNGNGSDTSSSSSTGGQQQQSRQSTKTTGGNGQLDPPQVGSSRLAPLFARAALEECHVDLRHDCATVCMSGAQFAEALLRCAHYWQALQSSATRYDPCADGRGGGGGGGGGGDGGRAASVNLTSTSTGGGRGSDCSSGSNDAAAAAANASPTPRQRGCAASAIGSQRGSFGTCGSTSSVGGGVGTLPSARASVAAPPALVHAHYEGLLGDCAPLCPQLLESFLVDWLLPGCLGGPGGCFGRRSGGGSGAGANPPVLTPFRAAIRDPCVQSLLASHQEELFRVFARYAKPREAFGIRSALPPPFSYFCNLPASGGGVGSPSSVGRKQQLSASLSRGQLGAAAWLPAPVLSRRGSRRQSVSAGQQPAASRLRDVGIVAVMSLAEVEAAAKGMRWGPNIISAAALRHCFEAVAVDPCREVGAVFFTEFLDLLCAVAAYADPSPMVSLAEKLERFIDERVLPEAERY